MKNMLLVAGIATVLTAAFLVWMDKILADHLEQFQAPENTVPALQQKASENPKKIYPIINDSTKLQSPVIAGTAWRCSGV